MEQHQSDRKAEDSFADTYNGLLGMAKKAGFNSVGDAIRAAAKAEAPVAAPIASNAEPDLEQLKALALAASVEQQSINDHFETKSAFEEAASPAVVLDLIARIGTLEGGFKLALGSLALKDHDEADRIGAMYRQQIARIEIGAAPAPALPYGWRDVIENMREHIGAGAYAEQAQHERGQIEPYLDNIIDEFEALERAAVSAATKPTANWPRPSDDELWDATLRDRDTYHEWADKLAEAISKYFDAYIGEHSNTNCPWYEALEAIEAATKPTADLSVTQSDIDLVRAAVFKSPNVDTQHAFERILAKPAMRDAWQVLIDAGINPGTKGMSLADGIRSLLATKPAAAPQDQQQDLHVAPPTRGTDSQHAASASVLTIEKIVQLIDKHTDRDFGLIVEPFARAIEAAVTLHLSSTTRAADGDRYRWLVETFGKTKLPAFLERNTDLCGYVADGKESIDTEIDWARAKSVATPMASTDAEVEAREQAFEDAAARCESAELLFDVDELMHRTKKELTAITANKLAEEIRALKRTKSAGAEGAES